MPRRQSEEKKREIQTSSIISREKEGRKLVFLDKDRFHLEFISLNDDALPTLSKKRRGFLVT